MKIKTKRTYKPKESDRAFIHRTIIFWFEDLKKMAKQISLKK